MPLTIGQDYNAVMGVLGILIVPVWLWLIWMSLRSGATWGWIDGPRRTERPVLFWLCMLAYLGLAAGFAWHEFARL